MNGLQSLRSVSQKAPFLILDRTENSESDFEADVRAISHGITTVSGFEATIEYFDSSVPDLPGYNEQPIQSAARLTAIFEQNGMTSEAIWLLHEAGCAPLEAAERHPTESSFDTPQAFFLAAGETITLAAPINKFLEDWTSNPAWMAPNQFGRGMQMDLFSGTRSRWTGLCKRPDMDQ